MLNEGDLIDDLELSMRAHNRLLEAGCRSIAQLLEYTARDLGAVKNCGRVTVREIQTELARHGWQLARESGLPMPRKEGDWTMKQAMDETEELGVFEVAQAAGLAAMAAKYSYETMSLAGDLLDDLLQSMVGDTYGHAAQVLKCALEMQEIVIVELTKAGVALIVPELECDCEEPEIAATQ